MQLVLNDEDAISIPLDDCAREAWVLQYERAHLSGEMDQFRRRLAQCLANSLAECLDPDLKLPTEAQLKYATQIAREMGVSLPSEALRFRGSMAEFIGRFADAFRQKRRSYLHQDSEQ
jgi:hypothetical protein